MDLTKRFQNATSCQTERINSLEVERKYPIVQAERVETKFGPSVLFGVLDSPFKTGKFFLPKQYSSVMTDDDIININSKKVSLHLGREIVSKLTPLSWLLKNKTVMDLYMLN